MPSTAVGRNQIARARRAAADKIRGGLLQINPIVHIARATVPVASVPMIIALQ